MSKNVFLFLFALLINTLSFAQITSSKEAEIDKVFESWNDPSKPGGVAVLIKEGEILHMKGYGSANIEGNVLITPQTKFQLGEMSKQFTTLAILLLEQQGKISMTDNIREYLPELPEYDYNITIAHLLNHSSGLYNINKIHTVINGSGTIKTQAEALKLITTQKTLSFKPGTKFSFYESVTESVLMAEIVARCSKQTFAAFIKNNIFKPLGMKNSLIRDDSGMLITNVAQPYQRIEESTSYMKNVVSSSVVGAINAYTTAEDLAKWYLNYANPQGKLGALVKKLDTPVKLTNGETFVYYWGEMAIGREFAHPERGLPIFWNYGFQGAYGTNVFRYIDQNVISFVLGNTSQYNGALANDMLNPLVKDLYPLPANIDYKTKKIKKLSTKQLQSFEGNYWFKEGYASQLFVKNDTLRSKWLFSNSDRYQTLIPLDDNIFQQYAEMEDTRLFKFKKEGNKMTLYFTYNESRPDVMERYKPVNLPDQTLQAYLGTYYNEEYASLFTFHIEEGQLIAKNLNHQDITFKPVKKDVFTSTSLFFNALEFLWDDSKDVKGFNMVTDGIHNLVFKKVK